MNYKTKEGAIESINKIIDQLTSSNDFNGNCYDFRIIKERLFGKLEFLPEGACDLISNVEASVSHDGEACVEIQFTNDYAGERVNFIYNKRQTKVDFVTFNGEVYEYTGCEIYNYNYEEGDNKTGFRKNRLTYTYGYKPFADIINEACIETNMRKMLSKDQIYEVVNNAMDSKIDFDRFIKLYPFTLGKHKRPVSIHLMKEWFNKTQKHTRDVLAREVTQNQGKNIEILRSAAKAMLCEFEFCFIDKESCGKEIAHELLSQIETDENAKAVEALSDLLVYVNYDEFIEDKIQYGRLTHVLVKHVHYYFKNRRL